MRPQRFDFHPQIPRKQIIGGHFQDLCEYEELQIRDAPVLSFQPGYRFPAGIPTIQLQLHCKLALRPAFLLTQFPHLRPDHIQLCRVVFNGRQSIRRTPDKMDSLPHILCLHCPPLFDKLPRDEIKRAMKSPQNSHFAPSLRQPSPANMGWYFPAFNACNVQTPGSEKTRSNNVCSER